jgi:hypothetical protein
MVLVNEKPSETRFKCRATVWTEELASDVSNASAQILIKYNHVRKSDVLYMWNALGVVCLVDPIKMPPTETTFVIVQPLLVILTGS